MTSTLSQDLRYAFRRLKRQPALSGLALLVVALGMGLSTAVFSLWNGLLLRPLPYRDPGRLTVVQEIHRTQGYSGSSYGNYLDWSRDVAAFESTAFVGTADGLRLTQVDGRELGGGSQEVAVAQVTASFLPMLDVPPVLGRWLSADDHDGAVVLTHGAWQRWFSGAPDVLGRTLVLERKPYTVVGVMPRRFHFNYGSTVAAFVPFTPDTTTRDARRAATFARLAGNASLRQAREQLSLVASRLAREYPATNGNWTFALAPLEHASDLVDAPVIRATWLAFAASLLVLAVCAANVVSLLLARAASRSRELAVRAALGASRAQLVRPVIAESLLLTLAGAVLGLPLAYAVRGAVARLLPSYLFDSVLTIDLSSFAFAVSGAVVLGACCGLLPALRVTATGPAEVLKEQASAVSASRGRLLDVLVAGELAVALVLLVTCGLLVRSLDRLGSVPLGHRTSSLITMALGVPDTRALAAVPTLYDELTSRAERLPGVVAAAVGEAPPMSNSYNGLPVIREGRAEPQDRRAIRALVHAVTPRYFRTLGIPLDRGRLFGPEDGALAQPVAIVSEALARREWPGEDPLGRSVRVGGAKRTVVGIVSDVRHRGPLSERLDDDVYVPQAQAPSRSAYLLVHGRNVAALAPALARLVRDVDPELTVTRVRTVEETFEAATAGPRAATRWATFLSAFALLLAATGLFGSTAHWVAQRSREWAVRQALGATRLEILRLVLGRTLRLAALGGTLGLAAAAALSRGVSSILYGVAPLDLVSYALAGLVAVAAALVATVGPALRAAASEPADALRRW